MDADERPYLNIEDILFNWLEMSGSCDTAKIACHAFLHLYQQNYWIDGKKSQFGNSRQNTTVTFPADALVISEDKLWLRYDVWDQWIPADITWSLSRYFMKFLPQYPSLVDLASEREKQRDKSRKAQLERERIDRLPVMEPDGIFHNEMRYKLRMGREVNSLQQGVQVQDAEVSYEYNADLYQGTLQISGNVNTTSAGENAKNLSFSTWKYTRMEQSLFHLFELGDLRLGPTVMMPSIVLNSAVHLQRLEHKRGVGNISLIGVAPEGTEVDLYHNGYLLASTVVKKDEASEGFETIDFLNLTKGFGLYQFKDMVVEGGGMMSLKFFYPDGSYSEDVVRIAPDNGLILAPFQWDSQAYWGKSPLGEIGHLDFRFGLLSNFSLGIHGYQMPDDALTRQTGFQHSVTAFGGDIALRPFYGMTILGETIQTANTFSYGIQSNISWLNPHVIQLEARFLDELSPLYSFYSGDQRTPKYYRVGHNVSWRSWFFSEDYQENTSKQKLNMSVRYRVSSPVSLFSESAFSKFWNDPSVLETYTFGGEYTTEYHGYRVSRNLSSIPSVSMSYRFQGKDSFPWEASLSVTRNDDNRVTASATIAWKPSDQFNTTVNATQNKQSIQVSWTDILSQENGPDQPRDFGTGTLSGKISIPKRKEAESIPLQGVVVRAGSKRGVTNENGEYRITGLPPYQTLEVSIDPASLDVGLVPKKARDMIRFRPSTHIEFNPQLSWSTGLDGQVNVGAGVKDPAFVEAVDADLEVVAKGKIEEDGFFLIEGLIPGKYTLRVKGIKPVPHPVQIVVEEGMDWIPGITFEGVDDEVLREQPLYEDSSPVFQEK
ncbi:MAG: carboxypeptidase regulatory-like domain-containing protein [SAR324 cluster bacterium]|nr:carboxypeptidase regulatory-like domain-containing protein [SAR324 cluster bacterium]